MKHNIIRFIATITAILPLTGMAADLPNCQNGLTLYVNNKTDLSLQVNPQQCSMPVKTPLPKTIPANTTTPVTASYFNNNGSCGFIFKDKLQTYFISFAFNKTQLTTVSCDGSLGYQISCTPPNPNSPQDITNNGDGTCSYEFSVDQVK